MTGATLTGMDRSYRDAAKVAARETPYSFEQAEKAMRAAADYGASADEALAALRSTAQSGLSDVWSAHVEMWRQRYLEQNRDRLLNAAPLRVRLLVKVRRLLRRPGWRDA